MFIDNSFCTVNKLCISLYFRNKKPLHIMRLYIDKKKVLVTLRGILNVFYIQILLESLNFNFLLQMKVSS